MTSLTETLLEQGIRLSSYAEGNRKITCPQCSHTRKNKHDTCLSVTIDGQSVRWLCHHCQWSGGASEGAERRPHRRHRAAPVKPHRGPGDPTPAVLEWFAARGISEETVRRNRIGATRAWIPSANAELDCIAFPSLRAGEVVNIKFRALASKAFAQVKGAEKILFGLDDIADAKTGIIVEGECDKLALEDAGYRNAVSVPDGAPAMVKHGEADPDDPKFEYLANCAEELNRLERIILAVDTDGPDVPSRRNWPAGLGASGAGVSAGRTPMTSNAKTPTKSSSFTGPVCCENA
jgi:twinkle protein